MIVCTSITPQDIERSLQMRVSETFLLVTTSYHKLQITKSMNNLSLRKLFKIENSLETFIPHKLIVSEYKVK